MRLECRARRTGKTTDAVKLANETGAYLVVRDREEAWRIDREHKPNRFPVTFAELLTNQMRGSYIRNLVIDNVDDLIQMVVGPCKIEAAFGTFEHNGCSSSQESRPSTSSEDK